MTAIQQTDPRIRSTGLFTGWAWCSWQIVSLLPSQIGQVGGAIAGLFWVAHWLQIARIKAALKTHQELDTEQKIESGRITKNAPERRSRAFSNGQSLVAAG